MKETIVIILVLIAVASGIYFWTRSSGTVITPVDNSEETVFCTADAMLCPDGSYVGRVPPTCEFAECPIPEEPVETDATTAPTTTDSVM